MSRARRPKQFLPLAGTESLLRAAYRRALNVAPASRVWVVAPKRLARAVRGELPKLPRERMIVEPTPRDTAPAIALACAVVARADSPQAVVCIFPTDQIVRNSRAFVRALQVAARQAREGSLVCLGIPPDRPATGFGYIRCARVPQREVAVAVERFVEKPNASRAGRYLRSGRYLWNAGIFVWQAGKFLEELERTEPAVLHAVRDHLAKRGRDGWSRSPRISVDYAVLERAKGVKTVPMRAGWDDLGSWQAAARLSAGRASRGVLALDSPGSAVFTDGTSRLVALLGVPGIVVVDTDDALMVLAGDRAEEVRRVVGKLSLLGRGDLL